MYKRSESVRLEPLRFRVRSTERPVAAPLRRTCTNEAAENPGQMALVSEPAGERNVGNRTGGARQKLLDRIDTTELAPLMRREAGADLEGSAEMLARQFAFRRDLRER